MQLDRKSTALIVVDMQERLAPAMHPDLWAAALANTKRLIVGAKTLGIPVLATEQYPEGLGPTVSDLATELEGVPRLPKLEFSALANATVAKTVRGLGVKSLVLAGIEAHVCMVQTVNSAVADYDVWVARDAVASRTQANAQAGLELMRETGAKLAPTETILFWLLEKAGSPEFKTVSKLVR
jgi:nicotinamidase-related amidase